MLRVWGVCAVFGWLFGATAVWASDKTALVVGIDRYQFGPDLLTPVADARAVANRLGELGFATTLVENPSQPQLLTALARFRLSSSEAAMTVVYVAGHGIRWQGNSFVLATDTPFADGMELIARSVPVEVILAAVSDKVRNKIVLIDACRDVPVVLQALAQWSGAPDYPDPKPRAGSFVMHSAHPGAPALDGDGPHSPFAASILEALQSPQSLDDFDRAVRAGVIARTNGAQVPWSQSSMLTKVFLGPQ